MKNNIIKIIGLIILAVCFGNIGVKAEVGYYSQCNYTDSEGDLVFRVSQTANGVVHFEALNPTRWVVHWGYNERIHFNVDFGSLEKSEFLVDGILDCKSTVPILYAAKEEKITYPLTTVYLWKDVKTEWIIYKEDFTYENSSGGGILFGVEWNNRKVTLTPGETVKNQLQPEDPKEAADCGDIFGGEFGKLLKSTLNIARWAVPLIIIGFTLVEFVKAIAAQNQDQIKKAMMTTVKRLIIGLIIFLAPTVVYFVLDIASDLVCRL